MSKKSYLNQIITNHLEISEMKKRAGSIYKCYAKETMKKLINIFAIFLLFNSVSICSESMNSEPFESKVGIHLLVDFSRSYEYLSKDISEQSIRTQLSHLNWEKQFYQFIVVLKPGVSMEVGGSLNPQHGLSAMYRDQAKRVVGIIVEPPNSVEEMANILSVFIKGGSTWQEKYEFKYTQFR